jgi:hypothetical protein
VKSRERRRAIYELPEKSREHRRGTPDISEPIKKSRELRRTMPDHDEQLESPRKRPRKNDKYGEVDSNKVDLQVEALKLLMENQIVRPKRKAYVYNY